MKKILLTFLAPFLGFVLAAAPKNADPEVFAGTKERINYTGVFPAHIKTVAVITPASYPAPRAVNKGIALLRAAGLNVKVYPAATMKPEGIGKNSYASVPVKLRVKDFEAAWNDRKNDIIICTRGGVGTEELVAAVNWKKLPKRPELYLLGYSDVTMLLSAMSAKGYGRPLAGPTVNSLPGLAKNILPLMKKMLHGEEVRIKLIPVKSGDCSGKVVAGLITRYTKVAKAGYGFKTEKRIVVIESVNRKAKEIASCLDELLAAGFFNGASGIVFGHISRSPDKAKTINAMIKNFANKVNIPVYRGFPFGHSSRNLVIDFTRPATIKNDIIIFPACKTSK